MPNMADVREACKWVVLNRPVTVKAVQGSWPSPLSKGLGPAKKGNRTI